MTWSWSRSSLVGLATAVLLLLTACDVPLSNGSFTYHVSADGDDTASGLNPKSAWRSLARVNEQVLEPGDTILLTGSRHLEGTLTLSWEDGGDPSNPVRITADAGFPGIAATGRAGIELTDVSGVLIEGVDVLVRGQEGTEGVHLYAQNGAGRHRGITIRDTTVVGAYNGISMGASASDAGFQQVLIERVLVRDSIRNGIITYGPQAPDYAHRDVQISEASVSDTQGISGETTNTGSGIVLGSVDGAVVEHSESAGNGRKADADEGPIGIWAHDATNVLFRDNVSHDNRSRGADGGGFGFDVGTTDSLMERNLSYANSGAGFLVFTHSGGGLTGRNTVRYNASVGDSQLNAFHGGISVMGGVTSDLDTTRVFDIHVHHNTVLAFGRSNAAALQFMGNLQGVKVHHNILDSSAGWAAPVNSRVINPSSKVEIFANQLSTNLIFPSPLFVWDEYSVYDIEEIQNLLPGSYGNFDTPASFIDSGSLPDGLAPLLPVFVEAKVPEGEESAEHDLLGNPVEFPDRTVGAIRPPWSARNARYRNTYPLA